MSPRSVGRLLLFLGAGGVLMGMAIAVIAVIAVDRIVSTADQTLDIAAATIEDVDAALDAAALTTQGAVESLDGLAAAIGDSTSTLEGSRVALDGIATIIETDLADSIDAVVSVLPVLGEVGDTLDKTLAALDSLGIAEAQDQSAGAAIRDMESSLRPVPSQLRTQATILGELNEDIGGIISRSAETRDDLASVREGLREAEQSLARFSTTASRLQGLITDTRNSLGVGRTLGFVVVVLVALVFISLQAVPLYIGVRLRRPDLPEMVGAILRDREGRLDADPGNGAD